MCIHCKRPFHSANVFLGLPRAATIWKFLLWWLHWIATHFISTIGGLLFTVNTATPNMVHAQLLSHTGRASHSPFSPRPHFPRLADCIITDYLPHLLRTSIGNTISWILFLWSEVLCVLRCCVSWHVLPRASPHFTRSACGMKGKIWSFLRY